MTAAERAERKVVGAMQGNGWTAVQETLEDRILLLLRPRQTLMFTELAAAIPECQWKTLFVALRTLSERQQVELIPHRWDYRVILRGEGIVKEG